MRPFINPLRQLPFKILLLIIVKLLYVIWLMLFIIYNIIFIIATKIFKKKWEKLINLNWQPTPQTFVKDFLNLIIYLYWWLPFLKVIFYQVKFKNFFKKNNFKFFFKIYLKILPWIVWNFLTGLPKITFIISRKILIEFNKLTDIKNIKIELHHQFLTYLIKDFNLTTKQFGLGAPITNNPNIVNINHILIWEWRWIFSTLFEEADNLNCVVLLCEIFVPRNSKLEILKFLQEFPEIKLVYQILNISGNFIIIILEKTYFFKKNKLSIQNFWNFYKISESKKYIVNFLLTRKFDKLILSTHLCFVQKKNINLLENYYAAINNDYNNVIIL